MQADIREAMASGAFQAALGEALRGNRRRARVSNGGLEGLGMSAAQLQELKEQLETRDGSRSATPLKQPPHEKSWGECELRRS